MPPITQQRVVLMACGNGAVVTLEHINEPPSEARSVYRLSSNNRTVRRDPVERMIGDGLLVPQQDGFPFGVAQTYRMARGDELKPA